MKKFFAVFLSATFLLAMATGGRAANVDKADVVFLIDYSGSMDPYINGVKENLTEFSRQLLGKNIDVRFAVIKYEETVEALDLDNGKWTSNVSVLENALGSITTIGGTENLNAAFEAMLSADVLALRSDAACFAFVLTDEPPSDGTIDNNGSTFYYGYYGSVTESAKKLVARNVVTSVVTEVSDSNAYGSYGSYGTLCREAYEDLCEQTGGKLLDINSDNYATLMKEFADSALQSIGDSLEVDRQIYRPYNPRNAVITPEQITDHISKMTSELGLAGRGEKVIRVIGPLSFDVDVRYYVPQTLDTVNAGDSLLGYLTTMTLPSGDIESPDISSVVRMAADNTSLFILDDSGAATKIVPSNKKVSVGGDMEANKVYMMMLTTTASNAASVSEQLSLAMIEPINLSDLQSADDVLSNIVEAIDGLESSLDIHFLTYKDLSSALEPTAAMKQAVKDQGYELVYKLDTIEVSWDITADAAVRRDIVSEDKHYRYYLFKVIYPDALLHLNSDDVRAFEVKRSEFEENTNGSVRLAVLPIVNGIGTLFDFNMMGIDIDTMEKQMLVVGLFEAAEPFSVYLGKILLMLLTGCNAGVGFGVLGFAVVAGVLLARHWRKK